MESRIADLDVEAVKRNAATTANDGDTTYDKAQMGIIGPSWTGCTGQGEYKCPVSGFDHHPDELKCYYCRKH
ncbi:unnamed protein product [Rotaria socialis]|uniref:Uncharacterized protein n=1 Tax=Rotaria socialis TaxID=392032 RepID=A0A820BNJ3_9BILA|nr:unnamed protein product [Rotaria socialis]CAF4201464.1 unnamed protein product [Rotaria socialis]